MKTYCILLMIIALTLLQGCGAPGESSSASFEVAHGFATVDGRFGGGLIISGRNLGTQQIFSISLAAGKTVTLPLEKGTWEFSATGWDGGGAASTEKVFAGVPYCGSKVQTLANETESVALHITKSGCLTGHFMNGNVADSDMTDSNNPKLKYFNDIITCNSFYTDLPLPSTVISSIGITASTSNNFCTEPSVPEDWKGRVKSVKIMSMHKMPGGSPLAGALVSGCMKATGGTVIEPMHTANPYHQYELRLPYSNTPFMLQTFQNDDCTRPVAQYPFERGLSAGAHDKFDHVFINDSSSTKKRLFLPANDLRRAKSPFLALMPFVKCHNGSSSYKCTTAPSAIIDFFGQTDGHKLFLKDHSTCGTPTTDGTSISCIQKDGGVEITLNNATSGDYTFTVNAKTYSIFLTSDDDQIKAFKSQKVLYDLIGSSNAEFPESFFTGHDHPKDHGNYTYGVLSRAREVLGANGAGGVVSVASETGTFAQACLAAVVSRKGIEVFNYDLLRLDKFEVSVENISARSPGAYTCLTASKSTDCLNNGSSLSFTKKITIYDLNQSLSIPSIILEFNCASMIGRMRSNEIHQKGAWKNISKELISWNTNTLANLAHQRFELVSQKNDYVQLATGSWSPQSEKRNMARLEKTSSDSVSGWHYEYGYKFNEDTNLYDQNLDSVQFVGTISDVLHFSHKGEVLSSNDSIEILTTPDTGIKTTRELPPSLGAADSQFILTAAWPRPITTTTQTFTSTIGADVGSDGEDDNSADKIDGTIPFKLDAFADGTFNNKINTLTNP